MITAAHFDFSIKHFQHHLMQAQAKFNRDPSASNWNACLKAMLVHQQLSYAMRSATVDKDKLFAELKSSPTVDWADLICLNTLGLSCADALIKHN